MVGYFPLYATKYKKSMLVFSEGGNIQFSKILDFGLSQLQISIFYKIGYIVLLFQISPNKLIVIFFSTKVRFWS